MNKHKNNQFKFRRFQYQLATTVAVLLTVIFIGLRFLFNTHATTPFANSEAESGAVSGSATSIGGNTAASGGNYLQFGAHASGNLVVRVSSSQLVNNASKQVRLLGVDASGTEDACIQNRGFSWGQLNSAEAIAMTSWHINAVRVPLNEDCWLGINGAPAAYSGQNYQQAIKQWVANLNNAGIVAILDLHWSAPGTYEADQQWPMADEDHSPAFWSSVASTFKVDPGVMFDLFNEPFIGKPNSLTSVAPWSCWLHGCNTTFTGTIEGTTDTSVTYATTGVQELVDTIRSTGAVQPILLGGLTWSSDPCGTKGKYTSTASCTELANLPSDPQKQLIIDFHNYLNGPCDTSSCWDSTVQAIHGANIPMVTDEFGESDCSSAFDNTFIDWADQNDISYLAWSWELYNQSTCKGLQLLSKWDGTPATNAPDGTNYRAHLLSVIPN